MKTRVKAGLYWLSALFVAALLMLTFPRLVAAQDDDPSGRVARLSYLRGPVSFQPAGESDWVTAVVNRPMTTGDRLWTDDGARSEIQLGSATVRLDVRTGLTFLNLNDQTTQIQLSEGTLDIRVVRLDRDENFEVDTPNQAFSILQAGQYRVQVNEDGSSTLVTVRAGSGEVTGGGRIYSVGAGLTGDFTGTDSLHADIFRAGDSDEFDSWSQSRDRRDNGSRSAKYVSRDVVGYEDLDDSGAWRSDPDYGDIWIPRVSAGWAPYRDGHWAWISPWGWTWVDDAPWGYAPFHYGRWVHAGNDWGWVPGPISVRPVYAPALVAFVGGPGFSVSISVGGGRGGNVGWFPLGPREVYVPSYSSSREYVTRVNVSSTTVNNTTIINVYNAQVSNNDRGGNRGNNGNNSEIKYANRGVPGGVTAVSQSTFTSAQPVGRAVVAVNQQELASAPVSRRAEVAPTRSSVFGTADTTGNHASRPPAEVASRSVVAKAPPPAPPVSFERQEQKLTAQPGQPLARNEVEGLRPSNAPAGKAMVRQAPAGKPATADSNQPREQPGNAQPQNRAPANAVERNAGNDTPAAQNGPTDRSNRGQPTSVQPTSPASANGSGAVPVSTAPAPRNRRPDQPNQVQPDNVQPTNRPPANSNGNLPANDNVPEDRNGRLNRSSTGQPDNAQPANPPSTGTGRNTPANIAPPAQNLRPEGTSRGQAGGAQPPNPPPANAGASPPANSIPATRNDRPDQSSRGQPDNPQPPNPPAPASNAPPPRNDGSDRSNRSRPDSVQPTNPPRADSASPSSKQGEQPPKDQPPPKSNEKKGKGQTEKS